MILDSRMLVKSSLVFISLTFRFFSVTLYKRKILSKIRQDFSSGRSVIIGSGKIQSYQWF